GRRDFLWPAPQVGVAAEAQVAAVRADRLHGLILRMATQGAMAGLAADPFVPSSLAGLGDVGVALLAGRAAGEHDREAAVVGQRADPVVAEGAEALGHEQA